MGYQRRRFTNLAAQGAAIACTVAVLLPLVAIFGYLLAKGFTLPEPGFLYAPAPSRWARRVAAWPTPSSAR